MIYSPNQRTTIPKTLEVPRRLKTHSQETGYSLLS